MTTSTPDPTGSGEQRVHYSDDTLTLLVGQAAEQMRTLPDRSVDCVVTSPPYYWMRDYGVEGQHGLESTPLEYLDNLRAVFREVYRVLADDGTMWINLADTYSQRSAVRVSSHQDGLHPDRPGTRKNWRASRAAGRARMSHENVIDDVGFVVAEKSLMGNPWRLALALQEDGWVHRSEIVWFKEAMPESVKDRPVRCHEKLFLFTKQRRYYYASQPWGDVWELPASRGVEGHSATYPVALAERCITAGCRPGGVVLDPYSGSGTTGVAATGLARRYIGVDLRADYHDIALRRMPTATNPYGEPA